MNREAWLMFLGLAVASAVGVLGFAAWKKNQELDEARVALASARQAAEQRAAHLAEASHALQLERQRAEALARDFATITNTQKRLESEMRAALESRDVAISELRGNLTVNILDRILFDSGEATLKPSGMQVLDEVAKVLARFESRQIQVFGHTDNVPIRLKYPSNWELSTARAVSAVRYLTEKAGVDPRSLSAVGCGEFQPIADNATAEGRAKNRRIALVVLPEQFSPTDVDPSQPSSESTVPATNESVVTPDGGATPGEPVSTPPADGKTPPTESIPSGTEKETGTATGTESTTGSDGSATQPPPSGADAGGETPGKDAEAKPEGEGVNIPLAEEPRDR
ncbi:MAG: OmpA family protein [Limisphaerales bacterium]